MGQHHSNAVKSVDYLSEERHCQRGWGDDLGQEEEEHSEREQDADGEADLLPGVGGKIEHQH